MTTNQLLEQLRDAQILFADAFACSNWIVATSAAQCMSEICRQLAQTQATPLDAVQPLLNAIAKYRTYAKN